MGTEIVFLLCFYILAHLVGALKIQYVVPLKIMHVLMPKSG